MGSLAFRHDVARWRRRRTRSGQHALLEEVFAQLPHGIAVTDRVSALLVCNRALEDLLELADDAPGLTCCELFGCGTPSGPRGSCLTEQPTRAGGCPHALVTRQPGVSPMWNTGATLHDDR